MKKIFKRITASVVFVAFLLGSTMLVTYESRATSVTANLLVKIAFEEFYDLEENSLDVVFIGSSAVYRDYITVENWNNYGFTSYSLATMSQPFGATSYLIEEAEKTQSPSLYVVEIRQLVADVVRELYDLDKNENAFDNMSRFLANCMKFSLNRYKMICEVLPDDTFYSCFDFIKNHSQWSAMTTKKFAENLFPQISYSRYMNMKCVNMVAVRTELEKQEWSSEATCTLPQNALEKLDKLLNYINKNDVEVLFVSTPYSESEEYKTAENAIGNYLSEKGFDYLNCNNYYDDIGLDFSSDFYDEKHTNVLGALKVTDFLGEYISSNYSVIGKHTQSAVDDWNSSYSVWEAECETLCKKVSET